jgi:hypothetical protein
VVDAAATTSTSRDKLAVTLVNRNPADPEIIDLVVRDLVFHGDARIRYVTAESNRDSRVLPDVEGARLEEGTLAAKGSALCLALPP